MLAPMARTLFGTDGVRGVVGEKITADLARSLGRAATNLSPARAPRVLIIRDTRESGEMLESALAAGVAPAGGEATLGGVLPTPAAALAVLRDRYDLAAVISASHNPYHDNGIKFFGPDGDKLVRRGRGGDRGARSAAAARRGAAVGRVRRAAAACSRTTSRALRARFAGLDLTGMRVLLDCANGATYRAAPAIFRALGAEGHGRSPTARRAQHQRARAARRTRSWSRRACATAASTSASPSTVTATASSRSTATAAIADGDELVALAAVHLKAEGRLPGDGVAMTVMTNFGFHRAMRDAGIAVATTKVGDRYVLAGPARARLRARRRAVRPHHRARLRPVGRRHRLGAADPRGARRARPRARAGLSTPLPQQLINVPVRGAATAVAAAPAVREAVSQRRARLADSGRVLVRPSGTEPLVRVMAEAPSCEQATAVCEQIAAAVRAAA